MKVGLEGFTSFWRVLPGSLSFGMSSFICLTDNWRGFHRSSPIFFSELESADYTTLRHRIRGLELEVLEKEGEMVFAVDATGIKVMNRGEWIRKYHDKERNGCIKVHVALESEFGEMLSIEITDEKTGDSEVFEELVEDLDLKECLMDGAYDTKEIFELLEKKGVDPPPGVKLRKDANTGLSPRGKAANEFHGLGYE